MSLRVPLVHKDIPHFGFDIGTHTVKVVQLRQAGKSHVVQGYGYCYFPVDAVTEGIVADPEAMAKAVRPLLKQLAYGSISTKRIVTGLPAAKIFTRTLKLPPMSQSDLEQAVHFEVEQYVPVPVNDLYIDYETINSVQAKDGEDGHVDVLMTAAPRAIVDSYLKLFELLDLEVYAVEASMASVVRAMLHSGDAQKNSTLVMDIGSESSDLTIFDEVIPLTGSVPVGGEHYTRALVNTLGLKPDQATEVKVKFGIAPSGMQPKIFAALEPHLQTVVKEAKRVLKYYEERSEKQQKVQSLVISGGTASMPGLAEYLEKELGLPLTIANPWKNLTTKKMQTVSKRDAPMYTTAIGLALRENQ